MRIIAGEHRGRVIDAPQGGGTRPTTDRVRESIMSSVFSAKDGFEGLRVLDAFAGSGAMGLESMSRGAYLAVLNDSGRDASRMLERNRDSLGYSDAKVRITSVDVEKAGLPSAGGPYDVVFLDPPYKMGQEQVLRFVADARDRGLLSDGCLVVYEHDEESDPDILGRFGFEPSREKKIGKTYVTYIIV